MTFLAFRAYQFSLQIQYWRDGVSEPAGVQGILFTILQLLDDKTTIIPY